MRLIGRAHCFTGLGTMKESHGFTRWSDGYNWGPPDRLLITCFKKKKTGQLASCIKSPTTFTREDFGTKMTWYDLLQGLLRVKYGSMQYWVFFLSFFSYLSVCHVVPLSGLQVVLGRYSKDLFYCSESLLTTVRYDVQSICRFKTLPSPSFSLYILQNLFDLEI